MPNEYSSNNPLTMVRKLQMQVTDQFHRNCLLHLQLYRRCPSTHRLPSTWASSFISVFLANYIWCVRTKFDGDYFGINCQVFESKEAVVCHGSWENNRTSNTKKQLFWNIWRQTHFLYWASRIIIKNTTVWIKKRYFMRLRLCKYSGLKNSYIFNTYVHLHAQAS